MKLLTKSHVNTMLANGAKDDNSSHKPVVKLFCPWGAATWLLTELDPDDHDRAFGLCDLGHGHPEFGYVSMRELADISGPLGLKIERDLHFTADKNISAYANEASRLGQIAA